MLSQIVAVSQNGVIGKNNRLPWHIPADLKHFKELTWGKKIIMGRRTYQSLPKKLTGRQLVVISKSLSSVESGVELYPDLASALSSLDKESEHMIIGGEKLYCQTIDLVDKIYLTLIEQDFVGDRFYPLASLKEFYLIDKEECKNSEVGFDYRFLSYQRRKPIPRVALC